MARTKTQNDAPETDALEVEVTETPAPEAEVTETPEVEIDLTAFQAALDAALEETDTATGTVPEANLDAVKSAYQGLDGLKPKNAAKNLVAESLKEAVNAGDMNRAKALMKVQSDALVAAKGGAAPKKAADPSEAYIAQRTLLTLALFLNSEQKAEGVAEDADERATQAATEALEKFRAEPEAEHDGILAKALKLAHSKVTRTASGTRVSSGERRDLGAHIAEAFADVEEGTFLTVAEIRKHKSGIYGDDSPSAGAITNRLGKRTEGGAFDGSACTVPGVKGEERDGKIGGVKVTA